MRRRFSKRVAPVLLAMSMVINSTGVNALAATGTAADPIPGKESSEAHETASKLTYDKVPDEAIEIIADTGTPSDTTGSPSNAKRISADIMPISDTPIGRYGNPAKTAAQLAEALGGAGYATADGSTVKLEKSIDFNDDLFIGSGDAITLDLGAYDLKLGNENEIILWSDGDGSYTDLTITGTGTISNNGIYPTIEIYAGGTLVIDGVTVENKYSEGLMSGSSIVGGAIGTNANSCCSGTEVNIEVKSGTVKGTQGINFSCSGTGTVTVSGGEVIGTLGQGIMVNDTYTVYDDPSHPDTSFSHEETGEDVGVIVAGEGTVRSIAKEGAAINAHGSSTVEINGGTVEATGALGIGINVTDDVVCTITDGKVSGTEMGVGTYATQGTGNASEIYIEGGEVSGRYGAVAYEGGTVVVSEGTVKGEAAAVAGNGSDTSEDTTIIIEGGKLEGGIAGIYHPQKGTLEITGGTITGEAGVVVRAGQVSISDEAVIEATGTGTVTIGDASTGGERIQVPAAAVVADQNAGYASDEMSVEISGGTLKAAEGASAVALTTGGKEDSEIDHEKFDITGGSFTNPGTNFAKYVDDNYIAANKGGETAVGKDLETVVEALGVTAGDTLTVEKAPEGYSASIADADITIDNQSGNDITVNNHEIASGDEYKTSEEDFVAKINEAGYTSLKDAVAHAQAGDTIILLTDITLEETVDITKAITLDLGTHEITVNKSGTSGAGIRGIGIAYTDVTMKNGTISSTVATKDDTLVLVTDGSLTTENMHFKTNNGYAINLYEFDALHKAQPATVTLSEDSTIENEEGEGITAYGAMSHHMINVEGTITVKGTHPAICGSYENLGGTDITIGDTAVINGSILQMSPGKVEIAGDVTCEKGSAVIVTNGSVTVKDTANITSEFQATEEWQPSADGHVYDDGSALFIEGADSVTIEGGVLDSYHAAAVSGHNTESTDMEIKGGTFKNVQGQKSVSIDSAKQFISGGTFSSDVKEYVAEDSMELKLTKKNTVAKYYVGPEAEEALAGAGFGDEVVFEHMGKSTSVEVPNGVHVQNETGADITVNNETLQNGHSETVVTEKDPEELSLTALRTAAADAKAKADTENPDAYTKSSWDAFTAVLKAAEDLLAEDNLTVNDQARVNQAASALRGAMDALEERADFTSLDNVLRVAKEKTAGKTEADYESGWNVYAAALEKAEQFLKAHPETERSEMKASEFQDEIERLADEVIRATSDLVEKAPGKEPEKDPEIPEKPNYEALNKAVADAETKKESDYTSASWKALEEALKNAKALLAESGLTKDDQARVDAAKDALTKAIAGLADKSTEYIWGSVGSGSGSSNSSTSQPADAWTYDAGRDKWTYGRKRYRNQWVYLFNPYAAQGREQYDWFYFDANGEMVTGWFTDTDGLTYYLNEFSDGTRGRMVTGWNWIADASGKKKCYYFSNISDGTRGHLLKGSATPDGYTVDASGAWVENGKAVEQ